MLRRVRQRGARAAPMVLLVSTLVTLAVCKGSTDPATWNLEDTRWQGEAVTAYGTNKLVLVFSRSVRSPDAENPVTGNVVPLYYVDFYHGTLFRTDAAYHEGADIYCPYPLNPRRMEWQARLDSRSEMTIWDGDGAWETTLTRTR